MRFLFLFLCSFSIYAQPVELPPTQYPIRLIKGYCMEDTTAAAFSYQYEYNLRKNLVKSIRDLNNHTHVEEHHFDYGPDNKIQKETVHIMKQGNMVLQSFTLYYYSEGNLVKKEFYSPASEIMSVEENDYAENFVVRSSSTYYTNGEPRLQSFNKYSYDKAGHLTSKDIFTGIGDLFTSCTYEYSGNLLINEVENEIRKKPSTTTYEYDDNSNLYKKMKDGKLFRRTYG